MVRLEDYISKVERNELFIPDFQRGYVWKKEQQKDLIASVLAGLPLGALLIVEGKGDDFLATKLGTNISIDDSVLHSQTTKYLVDGQQRLTTLVNVFSNKIHKFTQFDRSKLKGSALSFRWFLKIPRPQSLYDNHDVFAVKTLKFDAKNYIPTIELLDYIDADKIKVVPSSFDRELTPEAAVWYANEVLVKADRDYYLIPLFLYCDQNKRIVLDREFFGKALPAAITEDLLAAGIIKEEEKNLWRQNATPYCNDINYWIKDKLDNLNISEVNFSARERERAIEAYECMNRGGISLSTFDLLIAKASRVDREFLNHFVNYIEYETPDKLNKLFGFHTTGARKFIDDSSKNKDFINSFRNLLGLYVGVKNNNSQTARIEHTKESFILNKITADDVCNCYKPIINSMEKAAEFLMSKCAITQWREVQYKLMFNVVSFYYLITELTNEEVDENKIAAWWWTALFSAQFSRLSNMQMIDSINLLLGDQEYYKEVIQNRVYGGVQLSIFEGDIVGPLAFTDEKPKKRLITITEQYIRAAEPDTKLDTVRDTVFTEAGFYEFRTKVQEYIKHLLDR